MAHLQILVVLFTFRTYAIRRIRDAFRENKNIKDSEEIEELVNKAKANLEIIHRQVSLLYFFLFSKELFTHPSLQMGKIDPCLKYLWMNSGVYV
uniref:Complex 1 LYR protein domain-containing protein n=1 Tax=Apteryx owenii TaxID=8824 RepID=A0A8B9Q4S1_APTOW